MFLDPDPNSQHGSGSRTVKLVLIHTDPHPQHCFCASILTTSLLRLVRQNQSQLAITITINIIFAKRMPGGSCWFPPRCLLENRSTLGPPLSMGWTGTWCARTFYSAPPVFRLIPSERKQMSNEYYFTQQCIININLVLNIPYMKTLFSMRKMNYFSF